jgi:hypothetical protein
MRCSTNPSDLLAIRAATALLKPFCLKNRDSTAFASSLSAAINLERAVVVLWALATSKSSASATHRVHAEHKYNMRMSHTPKEEIC